MSDVIQQSAAIQIQEQATADITYPQSTTNKMQRFTVYFCGTLYMFRAGFSVHQQELKTAHTALSIGLTNTSRCMCSFELLLMDGKAVRHM